MSETTVSCSIDDSLVYQAVLTCSEVSCSPSCPCAAFRHVPLTSQRPLQLAALSDQVPILECGGFDTYLQAVGWKLGWIVVHDRHGALESEVCTCV